MTIQEYLENCIVDVPDFPKAGIVFKDITPALADANGFKSLIAHYAARYRNEGITQVVGIESRGFLLGSALAYELGCGLTLVRKPGKLPRETRSVSYELEYGTDTLHIHADALNADDKVIIVDDVLATGGTAAAALELVAATGANVHEITLLMELTFLNGREKLGDQAIYSVLEY